MAMKLSCLLGSVVIGTLMTTTVLELGLNQASAVTITNVKAKSLTVGGNLLVQPGAKTTVILTGMGSFDWNNSSAGDQAVRTEQITIVGSSDNTSKKDTLIFPESSTKKTTNSTLIFGPLLGVGKYTAQYTISVNPSDSITKDFEVREVPEPLTILGSATALGFGALLKRESSKKRKK